MFAQHTGKGRLHGLALAWMEEEEEGAANGESEERKVMLFANHRDTLLTSQTLNLLKKNKKKKKKHIIKQCCSYRMRREGRDKAEQSPGTFFLQLGGTSTQPLGL